MAGMKQGIETADMPSDMCDSVMAIAELETKPGDSESRIASRIKDKLDEDYGPYWSVTVGKKFGSQVSHDEHCYIFFYHKGMAYQIFRHH